MIRVAEIAGEPLAYGGQEMFLRNLLESAATRPRDLEIDLITPYSASNAEIEQLVKENGRLSALGAEFMPHDRIHALHLLDAHMSSEPVYDVVHIHSGSTMMLAQIAQIAKKAGAHKVIVHSHAASERIDLRTKVIRSLASPQFKKYADCIMACSRDAAESKYSPSLQNRCIIIRNGINIKKYEFNLAVRNRIRDRHGLSGKLVVGQVGRLVAEKNPSLTLKAFSQMESSLPDSALVFVGDGELRADLEREAKCFSKDKVHFIGNVGNPEDYMQAMDVLVLPSKREGFGLVVLEAQASGLPSIVSDGVPSEADVTGGVTHLDLSDTTKWAAAMASRGLERRHPEWASFVNKAGYDAIDAMEGIFREYKRPIGS